MELPTLLRSISLENELDPIEFLVLDGHLNDGEEGE